MHQYLYSTCILLIIFTASCNKEQDIDKKPAPVQAEAGDVWVLNQGAFGLGTGSVGLFTPHSGNYSLVAPKEGELPPFDVVQSATYVKDKLVISINESNALLTITSSVELTYYSFDYGKPRNLLYDSTSGKLYITNLTAGGVLVADTHSFEPRLAIPIQSSSTLIFPQWVEGLALYQDLLLASVVRENKVLLIQNEQVVGELPTGNSPQELVVKDDLLFVLCDGDLPEPADTFRPSIDVFDLKSRTLSRRMYFPDVSVYPSELIDGEAAFLYYLNNGLIYKFDTISAILPDQPLSDGLSGGSLYSLNYLPGLKEVWSGYAGTFTSEGRVYRYNTEGVEEQKFNAGIAPAYFIEAK